MDPQPSQVGAASAGPLTGVRVVDLTSTFMGPYCTLLLAQMGADVIKVEPPAGDVVRYIHDDRGTGMGPIFLAANRGKRSISLNLKLPEAREAMTRLIAGADVLVHNLRPDAALRLGIDPSRLTSAHPALVHCALQGFGSSGPYRNHAAYDDVIQAASGLAAVQGPPDRPEYVRSPIADKTVGLMAVGVICAALLQRERDGRGHAIEVPMFESMVTFALLDQQGGHVFDPPTGPTGYARTASAHRKPYRTADGYISVMVYTDQQWRSFFAMIGRPELADSTEYGSITARTRNIDELYLLVEQSVRTRPTGEWLRLFSGAGIPAGPVRTLPELFDDEHLAAVGMFPRVQHPSEGNLRLPRTPFTLDGRVSPEPPPAPALGQHGVEVLREVGYQPDEITALWRAGDLSGPCPSFQPS